MISTKEAKEKIYFGVVYYKVKNLFKKSFITITFYKIYCILYLTNIQLLILVPGFITLSNFFVYSV